ncbi:MAG: hypothetical protein LBD75_01970 [Candidatus Peribacteria bacterium]|nr:hypothetical protein [Candidatus Peribacteria bacterium]
MRTEITKQLEAVKKDASNSPTQIPTKTDKPPETQQTQDVLKESDLNFTLYSGISKKNIIDAVNEITNSTIKSQAISLLKEKKIKDFQVFLGMEGSEQDGKFGKKTLTVLQKYPKLTDGELNGIITAANTAIDAATTEEAITTAITTATQTAKMNNDNGNLPGTEVNYTEHPNYTTLKEKHDANQTRIKELEEMIDKYPKTREVTITNAKNRGVNQKEIDKYIATLDGIDANNKQELAQLKYQQSELTKGLSNENLLTSDESTMVNYLISVENSSKKVTTGDSST